MPRSILFQHRTYERSIQIEATATAVERCFTELDLVSQWLTPMFRCEAIGNWEAAVGNRCHLTIVSRFLRLGTIARVIVREPGSIVWQFEGALRGIDRWECEPNSEGTRLIHSREMTFSNPIFAWLFDRLFLSSTEHQNKVQISRLKAVAEEVQDKFNR
jgi:hypothetical protein